MGHIRQGHLKQLQTHCPHVLGKLEQDPQADCQRLQNKLLTHKQCAQATEGA